jgi:hypothetical protein
MRREQFLSDLKRALGRMSDQEKREIQYDYEEHFRMGMADASFSLDARSTSGDVTCRFPIVVEDRSTGGGNHVLAGKVGTGAGSVTVRTVSGDIRVTL